MSQKKTKNMKSETAPAPSAETAPAPSAAPAETARAPKPGDVTERTGGGPLPMLASHLSRAVAGTLPLDSIRVAENLRASGDTPADCVSLAESIASVGLLTPLLVTSDGMLVSGHRRHLALRMLRSPGEFHGLKLTLPAALPINFRAIPVRILPQDTPNTIVAALVVADNAHRIDAFRDPPTKIKAISRLLTVGYTEEEAGAAVGVSRGNVSNLAAWSRGRVPSDLMRSLETYYTARRKFGSDDDVRKAVARGETTDGGSWDMKRIVAAGHAANVWAGVARKPLGSDEPDLNKIRERIAPGGDWSLSGTGGAVETGPTKDGTAIILAATAEPGVPPALASIVSDLVSYFGRKPTALAPSAIAAKIRATVPAVPVKS